MKGEHMDSHGTVPYWNSGWITCYSRSPCQGVKNASELASHRESNEVFPRSCRKEHMGESAVKELPALEEPVPQKQNDQRARKRGGAWKSQGLSPDELYQLH